MSESDKTIVEHMAEAQILWRERVIADRDRLRAALEAVREKLPRMRREHYRNADDEFYNCSALGSRIDGAVGECDCGAARHNALLSELAGIVEGATK